MSFDTIVQYNTEQKNVHLRESFATILKLNAKYVDMVDKAVHKPHVGSRYLQS